jgi:hypothetical protein
MSWGRKAHFYCEVISARRETEAICSTKDRGLEITAAGWHGAIELHVRSIADEDYFEVRFIPWKKSDSDSKGVTLARGRLNFDEYGNELAGLIDNDNRGRCLVRLDKDMIEVMELIKAKQIMLGGGIPNTTD